MSFSQSKDKEITLAGGAKAILSYRDTAEQFEPVPGNLASDTLGATVEDEFPEGTLVRLPQGEQRFAEPGMRIKLLPEPDVLSIGSYRIDTATMRVEPALPPNLLVPAELADIWLHHLAQLTAPPRSAWIDQIEQRGVRVVEPMSRYGLYLYGDPATVKSLPQQLPFVAWTGLCHPGFRLASGVLGRQDISMLDLTIYPVDDVDIVREALRQLGARVIKAHVPPPDDGPTYATLTVQFDAPDGAAAIALARLPSVRWIEAMHQDIHEDGELSSLLAVGIRPIVPGYRDWLRRVELSGKDVAIAIADSGVDRNARNNIDGHLDLRGRQRAFVPYSDDHQSRDVTGHGTHVASIALGNAATGEMGVGLQSGFLWGQGVAPAAEYVTQNITRAKAGKPPVHEVARDAASHGADILNLSLHYGKPTSPQPEDYPRKVAQVDAAVRSPLGTRNAQKEMVIVGSAGNFGPGSRSISRPKEAKNIITVGASCPMADHAECANGLWHGSSRGPAPDGRILPTVVAPGMAVSGAAAENTGDPISSSNLYVSSTGTSYAAPIVSGICALLIEWWRSGHDGRNPSAAMLKALLVNGADDLHDAGLDNRDSAEHIPNNHQGWGAVNLLNIVEAPALCTVDSVRGPRLAFDQEMPLVADGEEVSIVVDPCLPQHPLRVTLVWTDAPGNYSDGPALRNDLDLEITELATGNHFVGNVFEDGFSVPFAPGEPIAPDAINNVECVYIAQPAGRYEIRVRAASLQQNARFPFDVHGWQDFALVIDNAVQITA